MFFQICGCLAWVPFKLDHMYIVCKQCTWSSGIFHTLRRFVSGLSEVDPEPGILTGEAAKRSILGRLTLPD
jgi:hypothetical protein